MWGGTPASRGLREGGRRGPGRGARRRGGWRGPRPGGEGAAGSLGRKAAGGGPGWPQKLPESCGARGPRGGGRDGKRQGLLWRSGVQPPSAPRFCPDNSLRSRHFRQEGGSYRSAGGRDQGLAFISGRNFLIGLLWFGRGQGFTYLLELLTLLKTYPRH